MGDLKAHISCNKAGKSLITLEVPTWKNFECILAIPGKATKVRRWMPLLQFRLIYKPHSDTSH